MRIFVYLLPFLMDLAVGGLCFLIPVRASELQASDPTVGWLGAVFSLNYIVTSWTLVRMIRKANAVRFIVFSQALLIALTMIVVNADAIWPLFTCMIAFGISAACFFVSFQVIMGDVSGASASKSAGLYTASWSSGMALGPVIVGVLYEHHANWLAVPIVLTSATILVALYLLLRNQEKPSTEGTSTTIPVPDSHPVPANHNYVRIGWIGLFVVTAIIVGLRTMLPKIGVERLTMSVEQVGWLLGISGLAQAAAGFASQYCAKWTYKMGQIWAFSVVGLIGLGICAWHSQQFHLVVFALSLTGVYAGHAFFHAVFYAINQSERMGHNVATNEVIVGIAAMIGSPVLGYTAQYLGGGWVFGICCIPIVLQFAAMAYTLRKQAPNCPGSP